MSLAILRITLAQKLPISSKVTFSIIFLSLLLISICAQAQQPDSSKHTGNGTNKSVRNIAIASGALYGMALYGLNKTWYEEFPRTEFHFFNDNSEWNRVAAPGRILRLTTG